MANTMAFQVTSDNFLVVVHTAMNPIDQEWDSYVNFCQAHQGAIRGLIVFTQGGGPNPKQRGRVEALLRGSAQPAPPISVVSDSITVRGIITAVHWLGAKNVRAFRGNEAFEALRHVNAVDAIASEILREASHLNYKLGISHLKAG